ncbi:MAG TPA: hypothetical protein GXZ67_03135 [Clostridiaceae bacterium]|jgi:MinD superfamily P-loop ATPase|nr:hypothetical protein [Clostridiaceae bacterium]
MGALSFIDYFILATIGLMVIGVLYLSHRSTKKKSSNCSGGCGSCKMACDVRSIDAAQKSTTHSQSK